MNGHPFIFGAGAGLGGGGGGGSISSLVVSDTTPNFGDIITITATPTGLTPTSYLFFAFDGSSITFIAEQAGAIANWTVSLSGTFDIYALATDGALEVYGTIEVTATSTLILDSIGVVPNFAISLRRLTINYTGPACVVMRSSDSATLAIPYIGEHLDIATLTTFVGVGNGFSATLFDQIGTNNAIQTTAAAIPSIVISGTVQTINGRPAIVFDGTTDQMVLASNVVFAHAFAVARKTANVNGAQMLLGATGGVGISVGGTFSTYNNISIITAGGVVSSAIDNTVAHQISFRLGSGGTAQIMVDGVISGTGTTAATLSCSHVGTDPQFNSRHVGFLSELFTFSSTLSDANRNILNANQKSYYGTP